jgi:eukaryotic-like serine/threonine-protein kinase
MATPSTCLHCGAPLVGGARQEFCPKCLFLEARAGLLDAGLDPDDSPLAKDSSLQVAPASSGLQSPESHSPLSTDRGSRITDHVSHPTLHSRLPESFGDYELLEELGRGGMGVVYRARQRSLNRVVAVKMMAFGPNLNPDLVERFRAEAVSAASLHHPNIVAIHEVGIHENQHFFVMDYVEGRSLAQGISDLRFRISDFTQSARWMKTTAEAVHYAHERGILHRDLKPSNVLIDAQDQPHVVDFGLARQLEGDSEFTVTGQVLGSPHYLPPEQAAGQRGRVSRRTDVYALGATLYHLLTGRPPFQAESLARTLDLVLHAEPVAPRLLNPSVPRDLETICLKCLEKEPVSRYPTARALAEELARFLAGEPIQARPLGPAGRAWRWCRRKPSLAAAIGVTLLSLLVGVVGIAVQWRRAEVQRARAAGSELSLQHRTYNAEINSAQLALQDHNPGRALELLNRHRPDGKSEIQNPKSGSLATTDPRGFEWRYLWQQCQNEAEQVIGKLPGRIRSLDVSEDGQWLFAGPQGGEPKLRNLRTGEEVRVAGEADWVWGAFSPDSRLLVTCAQTAESYGTLDVWDLQSRLRLEPILDPRPSFTMAFSPDGKWFAFGVQHPPWDRRLVILDFPTRKPVRELVTLTRIQGLDQGMAWLFTPDSRSVIFTENDPDLKVGLFDLTSDGGPQYFPGHREPITAMAISPDGRTLATGAGYTDTSIRLWEVPSFRAVGELSGHRAWITALKFSPDGNTLASAAADQTWRLWDTPAGSSRRIYPVPSDVRRLCFSPDGAKLFTGSGDGTILQWSLARQPPASQPEVWREPGEWKGVTAAPEGKWYAARRKGEVYLGVIHDPSPPTRLQELGTNNTCLLFSTDGQSLFAGTRSGEIRIWSLARQQLTRSLRGSAEPVVLLRQDAHGRVLLAAQWDTPYLPKYVRVWSAPDWQEQGSHPVPGLGGDIASTDGKWLAARWNAQAVRVWSLGSNPPQTHTLSFPGEVLHLAFSPNGRWLAAANLAGAVRVWEVPTFRECEEFQAHAHPVCAVAFSPDSRRLATAAHEYDAVKLWDVDTWQELIRLPHDGVGLQELLFSADGNRLVAMNSSGDLLLWHAPSLAEIEMKQKGVETQ